MICTHLEKHWTMCQVLRLHILPDEPEAVVQALRYFTAKKKTLLDPIESKAVSFVNEQCVNWRSPLRS